MSHPLMFMSKWVDRSTFLCNSQAEVLDVALVSLNWGSYPSLNKSTESGCMLISLNHSMPTLGSEDLFKYQ